MQFNFLHPVKMVFAATLLGMMLTGCDSNDEDDPDGLTSVEGHVFHPVQEQATDQNVAQLKVPANFTVSKFAENLGKPRMLAVGSDGQVYFTDRDAGTVTLLRDTNSDGKSDQSQVVANKPNMHGITIHNNQMYLVTVHEVFSAAINNDGTLGTLKMLISDLPDAGQHPNRTIAFGPDGKMYITVGSTCNACAEPNAENATILQANADGSNRKIFASGLRNTIGFGWHPQTQKMYGMDHGIDWLGDREQQEEVNLLEQGKFYGWPYIYGDGKFNPQPPPEDSTYEQYLAKTTLPLLQYEAHSAPLAMVFYTGSQFPSEYQTDAFVAMRGSWNRRDPVGYKVVRLHFENGQPTRFEDFLTGFLINNNTSHFGRLAGLTVHTDGSLLVSDDTNGVIYRVSYTP
ncbi:PQQ-dependent sugar dehydrogenase [Xanthocytophaga flava]|uniref:PQQ-dependent sugar dehydrogenase n=1 Tax=Xanthocytophaga flava TaxID=3048013 RepID=UPI0028D2D042|nr:PQQ-dependent sugar dehydrogenase [Xanthocytophaga flavus]